MRRHRARYDVIVIEYLQHVQHVHRTMSTLNKFYS